MRYFVNVLMCNIMPYMKVLILEHGKKNFHKMD